VSSSKNIKGIDRLINAHKDGKWVLLPPEHVSEVLNRIHSSESELQNIKEKIRVHNIQSVNPKFKIFL